MTPAHLLAGGLALPPVEGRAAVELPAAAVCALTGERLLRGYPVSAIVPDTTGEWLDLLRGQPCGYLSDDAARVLTRDWNLGNRAVFQRPDGGFDAFYPRIAASLAPPAESVSAIMNPAEMSSKERKTWERDGRLTRPTWSRLVRDVWPARAGQQALLILATDPKKRVWNRARVGPLGPATPVLVFDNSRHLLETRLVDWPALVATLDLVEEVYALGFSKRAIASFLPSETRAAQKVGLREAVALEARLAPHRALPHFPVAVIVAQKEVAPP